MKLPIAALGLVPLALVACSSGESPTKSLPSLGSGSELAVAALPIQRWYGTQQVLKGARVFQENCAVCHGTQGEGAPSWRTPGTDGKYPAPPLNGTGHAWHHPLRILFHVVKNGSPGGQGNMPAWAEKLNDEDMIAAIAWFQSKWSEEIYVVWTQRELASRNEGED